jgi:spore coat protein CotH
VQVGKGRVDIDEDDGFLVELDFYYDEDPKFKTNIVELPIMIKSPEDLDDPSGYDFVKDAINQLEDAMFDGSFPDSGYRDLINMNTFIDYMLIQDIVLNFELQVPASIYMYKDAGDLINMGPLWDFDNGFGSNDTPFAGSNQYRIPWHPDRLNWYGGDKFFQRFFDDPYFRTEYKNRWNEMYSSLISIPDFIDEMAAKLSKSYILEQQRWGTNHASAVPQLKAWWTERMAYLNTEINKY